MSDTRLIVYGAGGHGKVVADAAQRSGWNNILFVDDRWPQVERAGYWPVIGSGNELLRHLSGNDQVAVAIGDCRVRLGRVRSLLAQDVRLATVVHPNAVVSDYALIGEGTVVFAGAVVNVDSRLGMACIVNTGALVDHDCEISDGVHISPGACLAGGVAVGEASWIGMGARVRERVNIGAGVVVGAGSVVLKPVPDGSTVVGVPAVAVAESGQD
jgi:sugar O-acyltransferase (sialic acid O-acetyltransferase NeuD family)